MRSCVIAGVVQIIVAGLLTGTALADDAAARVASAKKMFDAQTAARIADDSKSFDATIAKDALLFEQQDLMGPAKAKVGTPKVSWFGACGAASAEVTMRSHTHPEIMVDAGAPAIQPPRVWHFLALVVPAGTEYQAKALGWLATELDKDLPNGRYNYIEKLAAEPSPTQLMTWLAQPAELANHLAKDPAVTVFGTSPTDRAYGPAAAKKLLASWRKLKLDVVAYNDKDSDEANGEVVVGDCAAARATIRMKIKDGSVLLHGFVIAHKAGDTWEVVDVAYSPDRTHE